MITRKRIGFWFLFVLLIAYVPLPQEIGYAQESVQPCPVPTDSSITLPELAQVANGNLVIQQYLSQGGSIATLEAQLRSQQLADFYEESVTATSTNWVWEADFNGDGIHDVLVNRHEFFETTPIRSYIAIFVCEGSHYTLLWEHRYISDLWFRLGLYVGAVGDMTGDGRAEFITHQFDGGSSGTYFFRLTVYTYQPNLETFVPDESFPGEDGRFMSFRAGQYTIVNGNFVAQFQGGTLNYRPQRDVWWIVSWEQEGWSAARLPLSEPIYDFHALQDGFLALNQDDYQTAIASFNRALDGSLQSLPWVSENDVISAAVYGLLLSYAGRDGMEAATTGAAFNQLNLLPDNIDTYSANFWKRYGALFFAAAQQEDISVACQLVRADIELNQESIYGSGAFDLSSDLSLSERACPY